jgi:hypothetical protein
MLPEPTIPRRRRAAPDPRTQPHPGTMTPLFAVPDSPGPVPPPARPPSRARRTPKEAPDLLAVTAERLRRALGRSFLRYGVPGDPEVAVHAAMNVIEPVLDARDTEIVRLRRLMGGKHPGR